MIKIKAFVWFPEIITVEKEIEIEVSDEWKGYEEDYFCENAIKIFEDAGFEGTDIYSALDASAAGYKNLKTTT